MTKIIDIMLKKAFVLDKYDHTNTKFGVVISINLHALPVHITQLTILSRFTEHLYVRSKPVFALHVQPWHFFHT